MTATTRFQPCHTLLRRSNRQHSRPPIVTDKSKFPRQRPATLHPRVAAGSEGGATKKALLRMLQPGGELADASSVIVYCTYQVR